ncbi:MAG: transglycosylase domain-containing protein [Oscillospiraceae bacterium]|nr:transglycosylase domain-containing protein [Oscillospiraceae bacterium]
MNNSPKYHKLPDENKPRVSKKQRIFTEESAKAADERAYIKNSKAKGKKRVKRLTPTQKVGQVLAVVGTTFLTLLLIAIITVCVVAVALSVYITQFAESMYDIDLEKLELSYNSFLLAKNPDYDPLDTESEEYVELFALSADENRIWVDLEDIPQHTIDCLVATEDMRFYEHAGVDWTRTLSIMVKEMLGGSGKVEGGSTITQQLVRDITKDNQVNIGRKLREIFRSISFEQKYSKHDILVHYLNRVAFGNTVYGVGSAARHYFDKTADELTIAESAILMGLLPSPVGFNPYANPRAARQRQEYSLGYMYDLGFISYAQYTDALNEEVRFRLPISAQCRCPEKDEKGKKIPRCDGDYFGYIDERYDEYYGLQGVNEDEDEDLYYLEADWSDLSNPFKFTDYAVRHNWYIDAALKEITNDLAVHFDESYERAALRLRRDGYRIYLCMDSVMQDKMEQVWNDPYLVRTVAYPSGVSARKVIQGAFVLMDFKGDVLAVSGGVGDKPGNDAFNRATQAQRNIGSTIKPFGVYAPAIDTGVITYSTMLMDWAGRIDDPDRPNSYKRWPENVGGNIGSGAYQPAWWAVQKSTNTISARTLNLLGPNTAYNFLIERLGFTTLLPRHINYSSLATGSVEMKLHEVAGAYQIFGTGGVYYKPAFYSRIEKHNGELILEKDYTGSQAIGADTAWIVNRMMDRAVHDDTGSGRFARMDSQGISVVGKTGTANNMSDVLFAGLTPDYVGVVRMGFDDNSKMTALPEQGDYWARPALVWNKVMTAVIPTDRPRNFDVIEAASGAEKISYCKKTGLAFGPNCEGQLVGYYKSSNKPMMCNHDDDTFDMVFSQEKEPLYRT